MIIQGFDLKEFVSKEIAAEYGDYIIWFVNPKLIGIAAWIKFKTASTVTINDWVFGGQRNYCGYYDTSSLSDFSDYSNSKIIKEMRTADLQHKMCNAIDVIVKGWSAEKVRQLIRDNFKDAHRFGLTTIMNHTEDWVHCDCRFTGANNDTLLEVASEKLKVGK